MRRWYPINVRLIGALVLILLNVACATLVLKAQAPAGFDLNGRWILAPELSDETPDPRKLRADSDREELKRRRVLSERGRTGSLMFITHDFPVLLAERMDIEQNADSMGIEYDRGGYRDVSWGRRTRELWDEYAGWTEGQLVIVSQTKNAQTKETMHLEDGGHLLVVAVEVDADGENVLVTRVFRRR